MVSQSTGLVLLERVMIEAYDLSFNLTIYVEPILTAELECSQNFSFYVLHRSHLGQI